MCSTLNVCTTYVYIGAKLPSFPRYNLTPSITVFQIYAKCLFFRQCIGTHIYDIVLRKINYQITSIV